MSVDNQHDLLPILDDRGFDAAMRGYDRRQVDEHLTRLDDEIRATAAERDSATARSADLAAQLASAQAQVESLRRQLRAATENVTEDNVEPKARAILDAAQREALRLRGESDIYVTESRQAADEAASRIVLTARAEADQIVADATERLSEADETFRRKISEAERYRDEAVSDAARAVEQSRAEEDRLTREAATHREALDRESTLSRQQAEFLSKETIAELEAAARAERAQATEDFEITLRLRRTQEQAISTTQLAAAAAESAQIVETAHTEATRLVAEASEQAAKLDAYANGMHSELTQLHARLGVVVATAPRPTVTSPRHYDGN